MTSFFQVRINYQSGSKQTHVNAGILSSIIIALATGDIKQIVKKMEQHNELKPLLFKWIEDKIMDEIKTVVSVKNPSILAKTNCEHLISLKNESVVDEMQKRAPTLYSVLKAAIVSRQRRKKIDEGKSNDTTLCGLAMVFGILMKHKALPWVLWHIGYRWCCTTVELRKQ